jgi:hypothetical protein
VAGVPRSPAAALPSALAAADLGAIGGGRVMAGGGTVGGSSPAGWARPTSA